MIKEIAAMDSIAGDFNARLEALLREKKALEEDIAKLKEQLEKYRKLKKIEEELEALNEALAEQERTNASEESKEELKEEIQAKLKELKSLKDQIEEEDGGKKSAGLLELEEDNSQMRAKLQDLSKELEAEKKIDRDRESN